MPHPWTPEDARKWAKLANLAARVLDEARLPGGAFRPGSLGDLKRARTGVWKAVYPTADRDQWPRLHAFATLCEDFAEGRADFRVAWEAELRRRLATAKLILGLTSMPPIAPPPAPPAKRPHWIDE